MAPVHRYGLSSTFSIINCLRRFPREVPVRQRTGLKYHDDDITAGHAADAVYTFKHALVQDAAYNSLLKARRTQLHGKIARVIKERLPHTEATVPELLAHHYTEAKQFEKAIPLWQKAGRLAIKRMALTEAIAHLNKGLELVISLPHSPERDGKEVDLRVLLGPTWMALRGPQVQEVSDSLHPALELANSLRRNDTLVPILGGSGPT